MSTCYSAVSAPTQYAQLADRQLAFRDIGRGIPLLMCVRFRGTLDSWDPAFIDALVERGFRVITFDYSGLGASTGEASYNPQALAADALALIDVLDLGQVVLAGWSIGGIAAQIALASAPQCVSRLVLLGTTPPGELVKCGEAQFYERAKRENDFEDHVALFFEPASAISREAATCSYERLALRKEGRSAPVPWQWAGQWLGEAPSTAPFPAPAVLQVLKHTRVPVLHIGGDHDPVFPVENWYALNGHLPTVQLITLPQAGHAPHHQQPQMCAGYIAAFVG